MKLTTIMRNGMIGTLIALVPVTSSIAATRPNSAVPMSSSAAATAALDDDDDGHTFGYLGLAAGVVLIGLFALLVLGDNGDDSVSDG